jgi:hypothetical protein
MEQNVLSREAILGADDLEYTTVEVPEWPDPVTGEPGNVRIRSLTGLEKDDFEQMMVTQIKSDETDGEGPNSQSKQVSIMNLRAKLFVLCVVDGEGNRLFRDSDMEALQKKNGNAIDRVWKVASVFNGVGDKAKEDIAKNS